MQEQRNDALATVPLPPPPPFFFCSFFSENISQRTTTLVTTITAHSMWGAGALSPEGSDKITLKRFC